MMLWVTTGAESGAAPPVPKDPRYQGKRLSDWLLSMPEAFQCHPTNAAPIVALGTNAVPFLDWVVGRTNFDSPRDIIHLLRVLRVAGEVEPTEQMFREIQAKAAFGLGALGSSAQAAIPPLISATQVRGGNLPGAAALALGAIAARDPHAIALLQESVRLHGTGAAAAGVGAVPVATGVGKGPALALRTLFARSGSVSDQARALVGLCQLSEDPNRAVGVLADAWGDWTTTLRMNLVVPLGRALGRQALPIMQAALKDVDPKIRQNALYVLQEIGTPDEAGLLELLESACRDPDPRVRNSAMGFLWRRASTADRTVEVLRGAVKDPDPLVRSLAIARLSQYKGPHLQAILDDLRPLLDTGITPQERRDLHAAVRRLEATLANEDAKAPAAR